MKIITVALLVALAACKTESNAPTKPAQNKQPTASTTAVRSAKLSVPELPRPADATAMIIPPQFVSEHPGWRPPGHDPKPIYPGALPVDDVFDKYWGLLEWGNKYVAEPGGLALAACRAAWEVRGNSVVTKMEWPLALHIVGDGTRLEVVEVLTEFAGWPDSFTDADKTCVVNAFAHRGQDSPIVADVTVDYPVCFSAPEETTR